MTTRHIMCDLETLDSSANAIIIAIGLVEFDLEKGALGEELYIELGINALKEQRSLGRELSLDTYCWWCQQSDEARKVFKLHDENVKCRTNKDAIDRLEWYFYEMGTAKDFEGQHNKTSLWGNGSTFDNVILRSYFQEFATKTPWHYSKDFCYRTMKALFANRAKVNRVGTHHNALDDAKTQAMHLIDIVKRLK